MERSEDQVTGLGGLDGNRHGFEIAHLADEQNVGILTQRCTEGVPERVGVRVDFALVDQTLWFSWTNSIGSSMAMMWSLRFLLT